MFEYGLTPYLFMDLTMPDLKSEGDLKETEGAGSKNTLPGAQILKAGYIFVSCFFILKNNLYGKRR